MEFFGDLFGILIFVSKQEHQFHDKTIKSNIACFRVFSRFCEIQSIPIGKDTDLTYEDLLSINAKYSDLSKCPELKVNDKLVQGQQKF